MARTKTVSLEFTDENGKIIKTSGTPREGGEGSVYNIKGRPNLVVKVYNDKKRSNTVEYNKLINKLKTMCEMGDNSLTQKAAWPQRIVYSNNKPVGFIMNKIKYCNTFHQLVDTVDRKEKFKNNNEWKFSLYVARNLAYAFHSLHSKGVVIGDVNESNFLIGNITLAEKDGAVDYKNNGIVFCIDCDSFQIIKGQSKFLCTVNKPEYLPPELTNIDLHAAIRTPNQDNFGLAVMIFQLLMLGRHPYAGIGVPGDIRDSINGGYFAYGISASKNKILPPRPSEMYLMIYNSLNNEIKSLFEQAFSPDINVWRPTSKEWGEALDRQISELVHCSKNGSHFYDKDGECIWCKIKKLYNYEPWSLNQNSAFSQIHYNFSKPNIKNSQQTQTSTKAGTASGYKQTAQSSTNTTSNGQQNSQTTANTNTANQNPPPSSQPSQNYTSSTKSSNAQNNNSTILDWLIFYPLGIIVFIIVEIFKFIKRRPVISIIIILVLLFYFIGSSEENNKTVNPPISNNTVVSSEPEYNKDETENIEATEEESAPVYTEEQKQADINEYKKKFIERVMSNWDPGHESFFIPTNSSMEVNIDREGHINCKEYNEDWRDAVNVVMNRAIQYDGTYDPLPDSYDGETLSFRIYFEGNDDSPKSSYRVSLTPIKINNPNPAPVESTEPAKTVTQKQPTSNNNLGTVNSQNKSKTQTNKTNNTNITQKQPQKEELKKEELKKEETKKEKTDLQKSSDYFFE